MYSTSVSLEYLCNTNLQGSWKKKLRMKFRNLRRPARAHKAGITIPPPAKKKKDDESVEPAAPSISDMAEYEQHINYIKKSYSSQKWSIASMSQLLQETAEERRRWIREDCPSVKDVLLKFPCLAEPKLVSSCMQAYTCTMYCAEKHCLRSLIFTYTLAPSGVLLMLPALYLNHSTVSSSLSDICTSRGYE